MVNKAHLKGNTCIKPTCKVSWLTYLILAMIKSQLLSYKLSGSSLLRIK